MDTYREALIALRSGKSAPANGNGYWSEYDRERLQRMYEDGTDISEITIDLGRTEVSVYSQLLQMGLFAPQCKQRDRSKKATVRCLCPNCECSSCLNYGKETCKRNV